jgi:cardiolipin synthase
MVEKITKNSHIAQVVMRLYHLIFCTFALALITCGFAVSHPELPKCPEEIRFYSNQTGDDLRLVLLEALAQTTTKLDISIFNFSDRKLLSCLTELAEKGCQIGITADSSSFCLLKRHFPHTIKYPHITGLMHRKIVIIDDHKLLIGSANFTKDSLQIHENLFALCDSTGLASALLQDKGGGQHFIFGSQTAELWLLPQDRKAEKRLLDLIDSAKETIRVAMFTWTSERFARAIIAAHRRGVDVQVALDRTSSMGTSKRVARQLNEAGIPLFVNQGAGLLHHKFALIDDRTLIMGSANWTVSAFVRNAEVVLILNPLTEVQQHFFTKLWNILSLPSKREDALDCEEKTA